jgi:glycosyltransferase involved in cell wall biosynthesis
MSEPMLSVISAVYNKARYLPALLQNLREQTGMAGAVEYVFADDVSTDGSADLLEAEAARDPRIRVIRNAENAGPSIRFNQAAEAARGSWLLPVDPDDRLSRNAAAVFLKVAPIWFSRVTGGGANRRISLLRRMSRYRMIHFC